MYLRFAESFHRKIKKMKIFVVLLLTILTFRTCSTYSIPRLSNGKTETETLMSILDSLRCFNMDVRGKLMKPSTPPWLIVKNEKMTLDHLRSLGVINPHMCLSTLSQHIDDFTNEMESTGLIRRMHEFIEKTKNYIGHVRREKENIFNEADMNYESLVNDLLNEHRFIVDKYHKTYVGFDTSIREASKEWCQGAAFGMKFDFWETPREMPEHFICT